MVKINWKEFKEYKVTHAKKDNFEILLNFMHSYYNVISPSELFDSFFADDLAKMMLEKREIGDAEDMENYLFKRKV